MAPPKNLLIVESASKAKTIQKYLNSIPELEALGKWEVMASLGHIMDLPPKEMGVDFKTWKMTYVPLEKKRDLIKKIKAAAAKAEAVYLASDPDREGEAIAQHLKDCIGNHKKMVRVAFNEITKAAIKNAVLHPRGIDAQLVDAQETRRIMDRVVGYEASPLLWRRFATQGLSAGRVQSAALCMIQHRAKEIEAHVPAPFWTIEGTFEPLGLVGTLHSSQKKALLEDEKSARSMIEDFIKHPKAKWAVTFDFKDSMRNPPPPLTTSAMQQEAYKKHSIPLKSTMRLAQALYEAGHITYMRTDSTTLSQDAQTMLVGYVRERFGEEMAVPRQYASKVANAQEAHEAIRPTDVSVLSKDLGEDMTAAHKKLYELIWRRAVASQMKAARYSSASFAIRTDDIKSLKSNGKDAREFRGTTEILMEKGYLEVLQPELKATPEALEKWKGYSLESGVTGLKMATCAALGDVTRPPSNYTESTLVKALEKEGIGRPSTYATIIDKLFDKGYVFKGSNPQSSVNVVQIKGTVPKSGSGSGAKGGAKYIEEELSEIRIGGSETDRMVPSSLGQRVCDYLEESVPLIVEIPFTVEMEGFLDEIAEGRKDMSVVLGKFYKTFHDQVETAQAVIKAKAKEPRVESQEKGTSPKNVLREFDGTHVKVVQTRFGAALFDEEAKKFYSVTPYMEWKNKSIEELTVRDVQFIQSLPRAVEGDGLEGVVAELGRYGLYLKKGEQNYRLPKEMWNAVANNKHDPTAIASILAQQDAAPKKKKWGKRATEKTKSQKA